MAFTERYVCILIEAIEELQAPGLLILADRSFLICFDRLASYSRCMRNLYILRHA